MRSIKVPTRVGCISIYPVGDVTHETIGIRMNREQALGLARMLLVGGAGMGRD